MLSGTDAAYVAIPSVLCLDRARQEMFAERNISSTLVSTLLPRTRGNTFIFVVFRYIVRYQQCNILTVLPCKSNNELSYKCRGHRNKTLLGLHIK